MGLEPAKASLELVRNHRRIVFRSNTEGAAHDLEKRQEWSLLAVGCAMPLNNQGFLGLQTLQKFEYEARLAETRLADQVDRAQSVSRPLKRFAHLR